MKAEFGTRIVNTDACSTSHIMVTLYRGYTGSKPATLECPDVKNYN